MPAALASSSAYWISGLSTTGSISFGSALVAGNVRVPRPATGKTALRTGLCMDLLDRFPSRRREDCHSPFRTGNATRRADHRLQTLQTGNLFNRATGG